MANDLQIASHVSLAILGIFFIIINAYYIFVIMGKKLSILMFLSIVPTAVGIAMALATDFGIFPSCTPQDPISREIKAYLYISTSLSVLCCLFVFYIWVSNCSFFSTFIIGILIMTTIVFAGLYGSYSGEKVDDSSKKRCVDDKYKYWFVFFNGFILILLLTIIIKLIANARDAKNMFNSGEYLDGYNDEGNVDLMEGDEVGNGGDDIDFNADMSNREMFNEMATLNKMYGKKRR